VFDTANSDRTTAETGVETEKTYSETITGLTSEEYIIGAHAEREINGEKVMVAGYFIRAETENLGGGN